MVSNSSSGESTLEKVYDSCQRISLLPSFTFAPKKRKEVELVAGSGVYIPKVEKEAIITEADGDPILVRKAFTSLFQNEDFATLSAMGRRWEKKVATEILQALLIFGNNYKHPVEMSVDMTDVVTIINNKCATKRRTNKMGNKRGQKRTISEKPKTTQYLQRLNNERKKKQARKTCKNNRNN